MTGGSGIWTQDWQITKVQKCSPYAGLWEKFLFFVQSTLLSHVWVFLWFTFLTCPSQFPDARAIFSEDECPCASLFTSFGKWKRMGRWAVEGRYYGLNGVPPQVHVKALTLQYFRMWPYLEIRGNQVYMRPLGMPGVCMKRGNWDTETHIEGRWCERMQGEAGPLVLVMTAPEN